jgi:hypothetical protein
MRRTEDCLVREGARTVIALAGVALLACGGCEDDRGARPPAGGDAAVDGGGGDAKVGGDSGSGTDVADGPGGVDGVGAMDAAADAGAQALYLLGGTIFGTPKVSYVVTARSLAAGTAIDYSAGVPIVGGAGLYGVERAGHFFVGSGETPTLTRFEVSPGGVFTKGKTMSLAGHGFSTALVNRSGVVFLSPTKAYFIHQEDLKAVIWNPTTMEIERTIALPPELTKPGQVVVFDGKAQRRGDELFLVATWADHGNGRYPAGALLITIDTTTDAVVAKETDPRCSQVYDSMKHPSGDLYYACSTWSAATNRVLGAEYAAPSCLLRIRPGERRFDPQFYVKVADLAGGRVAGGLIPGQGAEGFIRVLDETLFQVTPTVTVGEVTGAEAWRWWRLDLDQLTAAPIGALAPSAASATEIAIDGAVYTSLSKKDFSETTLVEMAAPGGPRPGLVARGYLETGLRVH